MRQPSSKLAPKKLVLTRETVKQLTWRELRDVAGALDTCSCGGPQCDCPDTIRGCG